MDGCECLFPTDSHLYIEPNQCTEGDINEVYKVQYNH